MNHPIVAALDIGSSKVCCIIAHINKDKKIKIAGYGYNASKGIKNGVITDINNATLSVCSAVEAAEQNAHERINGVILNVSGEKTCASIYDASIALKRSRPIGEADINKLMEKGLAKIDVGKNELIHCLLTNYKVDDGENIKDPRNIYGDKLAVNILLGMYPNILYKNLSSVVEEARLNIDSKVLSAYASGLACLIEDEREYGATIIDIGGGTTDIAVISLGGAVVSTSIKVAGDDFDEAIVRYMRKKHNLLIGDNTAEEIKIKIGTAFKRPEIEYLEVTGRNLVTGLPRTVKVSSEESEEALRDTTGQVVEAIHSVLEKTPPELAADIAARGIVLTGGGSLLRGLEDLIAYKTGINTMTAEDPMTAVAIGTGKYVEFLAGYTDSFS